jgi:hypothetical protein
LPSGWRILYHIAQLGKTLAERLIVEGRIHPRLTLREARELVAEFKPESVPEKPASSPLERRLERFSKFVLANATNWSREEREVFHLQLQRIIKQVPPNSNL